MGRSVGDVVDAILRVAAGLSAGSACKIKKFNNVLKNDCCALSTVAKRQILNPYKYNVLTTKSPNFVEPWKYICYRIQGSTSVIGIVVNN